MGLLKAGAGALGGVLADQWREYFYCKSMSADILAVKGEKRISDRNRSSNTKGDENIISNGSIIAVNEGQCMMIVEQGKVVEVCAEAGEFVYDSSTEPSIFFGSFGENLLNTFKAIGKRFTFGGDTAKDQRVYYFNTKEIIGNKYGTPSPIPFRVVDANVGLDIDIAVRCHGEYSYRLCDPILFYTNVCGNFVSEYSRENIDSQLKTELLTALQPAFARISAMGIRYSALPAHTFELGKALNEVLSEKWREKRGIEIGAVGISSVNASKEDENMIKELQRNAAFRNPSMAAAHLVGAQAEAMQSAAKNEGGMGAMGGFFGMNMSREAGGANAAELFAMGQGRQNFDSNAKPNTDSDSDTKTEDGWTCVCGKRGNIGKFCSECGSKKPEAGWKCSCGAVNTGKFCTECGQKKS